MCNMSENQMILITGRHACTHIPNSDDDQRVGQHGGDLALVADENMDLDYHRSSAEHQVQRTQTQAGQPVYRHVSRKQNMIPVINQSRAFPKHYPNHWTTTKKKEKRKGREGASCEFWENKMDTKWETMAKKEDSNCGRHAIRCWKSTSSFQVYILNRDQPVDTHGGKLWPVACQSMNPGYYRGSAEHQSLGTQTQLGRPAHRSVQENNI